MGEGDRRARTNGKFNFPAMILKRGNLREREREFEEDVKEGREEA